MFILKIAMPMLLRIKHLPYRFTNQLEGEF